VHHAVDPLFQFDEGTVGGEVANLTTDTGTGRVVVAGHFPRVGFELAGAERDLLLFLLDTKNDCLDLFADPKHFARLGDTLGPGKLGHVNEAFDTLLDLDKGTVGHKVDHLALDRRTNREASSIFSQGLSASCLRPRETRSRSRSISMIMTSISSPCLTISDGCWIRPQDISVM
jgi:hypothetical protein